MKVHYMHIHRSKSERVTWRRHMPAWVGIVWPGRKWGGVPTGLYVRFGPCVHLINCTRQARRAR